jgi:lysozyme
MSTVPFKAALMEQLVLDEGKVPHAYTDSLGFLTIGVGRLIDKKRGGGLSDDEIFYLLSNDVTKKYNHLVAELPWIVLLDEVRQATLVNMAFQLGVEGLLKFTNTLAMIKAGNFEDASKGMLKSLWARQTPNRAKKMAKQMLTGKWQ